MYAHVLLVLCFAVAQSDADCGGTFAALSGTIQSPNFPQEHGNDQNCTYTITAPKGYRITLNFTQMDLEASSLSGCYDYLEIRNGGDDTAPLFGRYCNNPVPFVRRSFENQLWMKFRSDSSVTSVGFSATYTAEPSNDTFLLITSSGRSGVSNDGSIFRVDTNTISNYRVPFNVSDGPDNPIAVDYDPVQKRIYWTENGRYQNGIRSSFLNGTDVETVLNASRAATLDGIAVDHLSRLIFYTDAGNNRVAMVTMSSYAHKTIVTTGVMNPRAIVLDIKNGVLFWSDWSSPAKIERANYDGSDRRAVVDMSLYYTNGLALDVQNNKLYWADAGTDRVESSDLEGNGRTVHYQGSASKHFFGLALFESTLFLTDWGPNGASSSRSYIVKQPLSTNTTNVTRIGSIAERLNDIHAYHEKILASAPNGCGNNNGGCSVICIPLPNNSSKCACADGDIMDSDGITCVQGPTTTPAPSTTPRPVTPCGRTFTALTGKIQSPNFPNNYDSNLNCTYVITAPVGSRITVNFSHMDFETSVINTGCPYDYIEIRDGDNGTAPYFGRFCKQTLPFVRRSFGNKLYIKFFTDSSLTHTGFNATYKSERMDDTFLLVTSSGRTSTSNDGAIFRIDPETISNYRVNMSITLDNPIAVDYDPVEGRIYWTESSRYFNRIRSSNLDGSNVKTVYSSFLVAVLDGIAVDPLSRLIFYTDAGNNRIAMVTMSTPHQRKIVASSQVEKPRAIVLDTANGVVYWTDWAAPAKIERANYDGSGRRTLVNLELVYTNGLAIDVPNNKLYWVDAGTNRVESSDLEGNRRQIIYTGSSSRHFFGLALFQNALYISDWGVYGSSSTRSYILKASLTNGTRVTQIGSISERLNDVHAYHQNSLDSGPNGCGSNNGGCSVICIPLPSNSSKCACSDNEMLSSNGTTCVPATIIATTTPKTTLGTTTPIPRSVYASITPSESNPFVTDGSKRLTLTCVLSPDEPVIGYKWDVPCVSRVGSTCTIIPKVADDGKVVTCTPTLANGRTVDSAGYHISLNYPPPSAPVITGYNSGVLNQPGDNLTLTCTVSGGKPLVRHVVFECPDYPDNEADVFGAKDVHSVLDIGPLRAKDNGRTCECYATWTHPAFYNQGSSVTLRVNGGHSPFTPTTGNPSPSTTFAGQGVANQVTGDKDSNTGSIVGGVVGVGVLLIIVLIVIIFLIMRKRRRQPRDDTQAIVSESPPQYQDPAVGFGNLGNSAFAMYNPTYDTPGAVGGVTVTESEDNNRNAAQDNAGEFHKVPLDPSQVVSAADASAQDNEKY
ncbi:low-density lipoprotein receptor-related protein 4-like isoform X2 [Littorina saxatilis]|uniref:low-density lipoprotein receptor-related protein 4-like isoform X2 n=1 Tax=Littorina saxatilis TaxID=31220 RepID=UPI0038B5648A